MSCSIYELLHNLAQRVEKRKQEEGKMRHEDYVQKMVGRYDKPELELRLKEAKIDKRELERKIWDLSKEREHYEMKKEIKEKEIEEIKKRLEKEGENDG